MSKSTKFDAPATPLNPAPWIPKSPEGTPEHLAEIWQHHQENLSKRERKIDPPVPEKESKSSRPFQAPPVIPPCQGGVWYHEGQALLKDDSWYQRELAKRHAERDAFWGEINENVKAILARDAAKKAQEAEAARAAEREAQEAQEAARKAAQAARIAAAQGPSTWRPSKDTVPRKTKAERAAELQREKVRNKWEREELEWLDKHRHLWGIPDESQNLVKLAQRYYVTSVMCDNARREHAIIDRAAFDCNRIINQRFPALEFSEMEFLNGGHAIDLNYYRTPKPKGRKRNK